MRISRLPLLKFSKGPSKEEMHRRFLSKLSPPIRGLITWKEGIDQFYWRECEKNGTFDEEYKEWLRIHGVII